MQNLSDKTEFNLYEHEPVGRTHFHMNGSLKELFCQHRNGLFLVEKNKILRSRCSWLGDALG